MRKVWIHNNVFSLIPGQITNEEQNHIFDKDGVSEWYHRNVACGASGKDWRYRGRRQRAGTCLKKYLRWIFLLRGIDSYQKVCACRQPRQFCEHSPWLQRLLFQQVSVLLIGSSISLPNQAGAVSTGFLKFSFILFMTWLSAKVKLQSISSPAELLQIHLPVLTQILTQVCAEAGGRNG